jgi:uncharacterized membrane protein|tara:strand:+ start:303 stop:509 length:207 start_codon:yes stop_codon:yes gene_type:complete
MKSHAKRSLAKTISWRVLATTDTFIISWFITGELFFAGAIASLEILTKTILYYLHERGWNKIRWGINK